ncbi:MAG: dihydrofolate reductase [Variibacter sp.]|nr:dihydrofolate reductase [Variibacter sp.]
MKLVIVAAVSENGVIGRDGDMPWRLRSDLRRFRARTMGRPIVMGRKTYESLGAPLKGRTNIVVSRDPAFAAPGIAVAADLARALESARGDALRRGVDEIIIGGGGHLYRELLPRGDVLELTRVHQTIEGDTSFPPVDAAQWQELAREEPPQGPEDSARVSFITYLRKPPRPAAN